MANEPNEAQEGRGGFPTPTTIQGWVTSISLLAAAMGGVVTSTYQFGLKAHWWGKYDGDLAVSARILADEHIGENPATAVTVVDVSDDYQVVKLFKNGDALYFRRTIGLDGQLIRHNRWTSRRSMEQILQSGDSAASLISLSKVAEAAEHVTSPNAQGYVEEFVGWNDHDAGISVYKVTAPDGSVGCVLIDEATGEAVERFAPPCEAKVTEKPVPKQQGQLR